MTSNLTEEFQILNKNIVFLSFRTSVEQNNFLAGLENLLLDSKNGDMKFLLRNDDKLVKMGSLSLNTFKNPHLNMMLSYKIFISFAFEDEETLLNPLVLTLRQLNLCVSTYREIDNGTSLPDEEAKMIRESKITVILLTDSFIVKIKGNVMKSSYQ